MQNQNLIGKIIKDFHILTYIDRGRYGMVYKARHLTKRKNYYALKFNLQETHQVQQDVDYFHPNLMQIIQKFQYEGNLAIVMPFIGKNLDEMPRFKCQLKFKQIFTQICCGLRHIHEQGMIHGDVKLNNIMCKVNPSSTTYILSDYSLTRKSQNWQKDIYDLLLTMWDWLFDQDLRNNLQKRISLTQFHSINLDKRLAQLMPQIIHFMRFMIRKEMRDLPSTDQIIEKLKQLPNVSNILKAIKKNRKSKLKLKKGKKIVKQK